MNQPIILQPDIDKSAKLRDVPHNPGDNITHLKLFNAHLFLLEDLE